MDSATLYGMYSVAKELASISPKLKKLIEQKAKADDPVFFQNLLMAEDIRDLKVKTILPLLLALRWQTPVYRKKKFYEGFWRVHVLHKR